MALLLGITRRRLQLDFKAKHFRVQSLTCHKTWAGNGNYNLLPFLNLLSLIRLSSPHFLLEWWKFGYILIYQTFIK